jgi:hypothetical protein
MNKLHLILALAFAYCGSVYAQSPPVAVLSDIPTQESMNAWKVKNDEVRDLSIKVCTNEANKLYFAKSPCNISDITLQYLSDTSKATPAEKKVIMSIDNEYLAIAKMRAENSRQNIKPEALGNAFYRFWMAVNAQFQDSLTKLYAGKITWGEFNAERKVMADRARAEFEKINKDTSLQK